MLGEKLLRNGKSVPTNVAIISLAGFSFAVVSIILQIWNCISISSFSKQLVLVQLNSGQATYAQLANTDERANPVIKRFVSNVFVRMFNWNGLIQSLDKGEIVTSPDSGVRLGDNKIATEAYNASFALSENQNFRAEFLKKLSQITPREIFTGGVQVSLVPRYVGEPRKLMSGKWEVDLVATLLTFQKNDGVGSGIPFNKTITVEAVSTPDPNDANTELTKQIYSVRSSGLEITKIVDLDLNNTNNNEPK